MNNLTNTLLRRKELLALTVLVLITVAIRVPGVFSRAIWYDEAITLLETAGNAIPSWSEFPTRAETQKELLAGSPTLREVAAGLRKTDVHPPVYYGLLSIWRRLAGESIETARLFSVFWSTATVILLYMLLRVSGFLRPFWPSLVYSLSSGAVHYGHEARNYSLAMFFVILATFLAYFFKKTSFDRRSKTWIISVSIGVSCGLAFQTNYLTVFPITALLVWSFASAAKKHKPYVIQAILLSVLISLAGFSTLMVQIGARPNQFHKALGFAQEIAKIINANLVLLWNPVVSNGGIRWFVLGTVLVLLLLSAAYLKNAWGTIDTGLFTLMVGLAIAPSLGVLALDLIFSKSLGKSSYVFFAGPAIAYLLTLPIGSRLKPLSEGSHRPAIRPAGIVRYVLPVFVLVQLTGINFNLERTPGFAGSKLRSFVRRIEASSPAPMVVIGAGHGRGDPATVIYELSSETKVCVIDNGTDVSRLSSEIAPFDTIWMVFAKGRKTNTGEQALFDVLAEGDTYQVISRTKRFAHLKKN